MQTIKQLPKDVIAKIAAGEVVERPLSVVKELVENALDAEATHIDIELIDGGLKKIVVCDDGKGMSEEDIIESFKPHTTSKLFSADDLYSLSSYGFRGEALSSIAAVSDMTIKSRERNTEFGIELEISTGELIDQKKIGMPVGTEIIIENLFKNIPARKKFLTSVSNELRAVSDFIMRTALAFPSISFNVKHNNSVIANYPRTEDSGSRIKHAIPDIYEHLLPFSGMSEYGSIEGFIGRPQLSTTAPFHQYIFVNKRVVSHLPLARLIKESFGSLLEPRDYPIFIIHLSVPPETIDVNVHPRKEEVAFSAWPTLQKLIQSSIEETLTANDLKFTDSAPRQDMDRHLADILKETMNAWSPKELAAQEIAQIQNLYLVTQTSKGLLLIDQHAAHERILYEQFKQAFEATRAHQTPVELSEPIIFELSSSHAQLLESELPTFTQLGFEIELFGKNTFKVSAVPPLFLNRDHVKLIKEVLGDIQEHGAAKSIDRETDKTLSYLACRSAIKAGDPLTMDERKHIIEKLLQATTPYTCPHGRPTHIEITMRELDKMFKRA